MKKIFFIIFLLATTGSVMAQNYAYVDMEYILNKIPSYTNAQKQLEQMSSEYQKELENKHSVIANMYSDYQKQSSALSSIIRKQKEDAIVSSEKEYKALQKKYFGPDGILSQKRESLLKPIQESVNKSIQSIAVQKGYAVIFNKTDQSVIVYTNPAYDVSNLVLGRLGINN